MRTPTAIPGSPPDICRAALQADIDQGGLLNLPGKYLIDRPLIIDQNETSLTSDNQGSIQNTRNGGCLIMGVKRKFLSADHWPMTGGIRTCGDSRIVFQSSPWSKLSPQMTISCQVTANRGWGTDQTPLFGSMYNGEPGPFYCEVVNGGTRLAFMFKTADGIIHEAAAPISGTALPLWVGIDLIAGKINLNSGLVAPCNPPLLPNSAWYPSDTALFQIGAIGDGILAPNPYDLTFSQLSIGPTAPAPWISLVGQWWTDSSPGQPFVHAFGTEGHSYGILQGNLTNGDTIGENSIRDLRLIGGGYGQVLGIGLAYDPQLERVHTYGGKQSIGSVNAGVSYLIAMRDCMLEDAADTLLYLCDAELSALGTRFRYPGKSAAILKGCDANFTDTSITDAPEVTDVFRMLDNRGNGGVYSFRGGTADFEGGSPVSYWHCERHANTPKTTIRIEDWAIGKLSGPAHVVLTDSLLSQGPAQSQCFANIDRSLSVQADKCWEVSQM